MLIPKQLDWNDHMFKKREAYVSSDDQVDCALYRTVCREKCHHCVWLREITEADGQTKVICQPPVIWEE